jgi:hypothetical protein
MIYFELLASLILRGHVLTAYDATIEAYDTLLLLLLTSTTPALARLLSVAVP